MQTARKQPTAEQKAFIAGFVTAVRSRYELDTTPKANAKAVQGLLEGDQHVYSTPTPHLAQPKGEGEFVGEQFGADSLIKQCHDFIQAFEQLQGEQSAKFAGVNLYGAVKEFGPMEWQQIVTWLVGYQIYLQKEIGFLSQFLACEAIENSPVLRDIRAQSVEFWKKNDATMVDPVTSARLVRRIVSEIETVAEEQAAEALRRQRGA